MNTPTPQTALQTTRLTGPTDVFGAADGFAMTSTAELTIRMIVALALILTLLAIITRYGRRYLTNRDTTGPRITIQHQHQLTKHTNLTLLTTGTTTLLIATNNQTTTLLAQGPQLTQTPTKPTDTNNNTGNKPNNTDTNTTHNIDIRTKPNPLKTLQNKTVRR